jgi:hypothetical protein
MSISFPVPPKSAGAAAGGGEGGDAPVPPRDDWILPTGDWLCPVPDCGNLNLKVRGNCTIGEI